MCVCLYVANGWEVSSAEKRYAMLPWKNRSPCKLFLNRVVALVRGRDVELLAQEAALRLHGFSGIM